MLATSPSPRLTPSPCHPRSTADSPRFRYNSLRKSSHGGSPISRPNPSHVCAAPKPAQPTPRCSPHKTPISSESTIFVPAQTSRRKMVDASTQYSPPPGYVSPAAAAKPPISQVAQLNLSGSGQNSAPPSEAIPAEPKIQPEEAARDQSAQPHSSQAKRHASDSAEAAQTTQNVQSIAQVDGQQQEHDQGSSSKRPRPEGPPAKMMPIQYENCEPRDLVILISSMLMELVRYNDTIPLRDGALTRFHSRAPPTISVIDYLQRLTTHATLSPPILLSMIYYIDRLCALYPAFTISSLTVHRFLITSATVASKGLSDSFWTNKTYARVGGVSVKELALLELEFLVRVQWRIVPKPEVLEEYYRSLVERSPGYEIEQADDVAPQTAASPQPT